MRWRVRVAGFFRGVGSAFPGTPHTQVGAPVGLRSVQAPACGRYLLACIGQAPTPCQDDEGQPADFAFLNLNLVV